MFSPATDVGVSIVDHLGEVGGIGTSGRDKNAIEVRILDIQRSFPPFNGSTVGRDGQFGSDGPVVGSENAYAVDVISCMLYRVAIKPDGRYGFTLFY